MTIRALDGLRGFAVLLVLLSHMSLHGINLIGPLNFAGIGKAGVYLFFALSAFLLTWQALQLEESVRKTGRYWIGYGIRRVLRIYPLYLVVLLVTLLLHMAEQNINPKVTSWQQLIDHVVLLDGQHIYWAIPVEFKYYLILPLVTFVLALTTRKHHLYSLATIMSAITVAAIFWPASETPNNSISLGPYLGIFLLGSLGAAIGPGTLKNTRLAEPLGWLCLLGAMITIPAIWRSVVDAEASNQVLQKEFLLYGVLWTICIVASMSRTHFAAFFELAAWRFLGRVSFSIYLWHYFIVQMVDRHLDIHPSLQFILVVLLVLPAAWISYRLIERPFINWGHKATNQWNKSEQAA